MWSVVVSKKAEKSLLSIKQPTQNKIARFLVDLRNGFFIDNWDIKKLSGFENQYRCRVGNYRILYEVNKKEIVIYIIEILPRKDAYK